MVHDIYIYIYRERERERLANVHSNVYGPKYIRFKFKISKSKRSIRTVHLVLHINMCLETKFYIFLNFFLLFIKYFTKLLIQQWLHKTVKSGVHRWISDFQSGLINSKKIPKNVKFGLLADINM